MINPNTVIFAIQAGIKLGNKVHQVLIDKNQERPLVLPLGDSIGSVTATQAREYFRNHPELTAAGGPYAGFQSDELVKAYRTLQKISNDLGDADAEAETARAIILQLNGLEQVKKEFASKPAIQRVLGTVAEIGIEYFTANPKMLGENSNSRRILESFISHLPEIDIDKTTPKDLLHDVLHASLRTLQDQVTLIDDDMRLQTLVGGVTASLLEDYDKLSTAAERTDRGALIRRVSSSIVGGGASAFTGNIDLFVRDDAKAKKLVQSTLSSLVAGIAGKEDLFTNESLELIYHSALTAASENSGMFTDSAHLQTLIKSTVTALSSAKGVSVFGEETVPAIVEAALQAVQENVETLMDPEDPKQQRLAVAIGAIANGLSSTLAGGGTVRDLLSKRQLVELTKIAFSEVARSPEKLLDGVDDDQRKTVLAQIIGSLAKALGDDPKKLVTGDGFLNLVHSALQTGVLNADKLLDLETTNVRTNVLFQITQQAAAAVLEHPDPRGLVSRDVFVTIMDHILPAVSANLDGLLGSELKQPVKATISKALDLASGSLQNRVNGANLPALIEELLVQVLQEELPLDELATVTTVATTILKHV